MVFRRKKDESGKSLLAPAAKKQRGFFRRSSNSSGERRSDNPGETRTGLDSAPNWKKVRAPSTPPLTPDNDVYGRAPVSNVTVNNKGKGNKFHGSSNRNSSSLSKSNNNNHPHTRSIKDMVGESGGITDDERTEYSDLTDNRTLQRLNEQKAAYDQALRQKQMQNSASQSLGSSRGSNPATILKEKTQRDDPNAPLASANSPGTDIQKDEAPRSFLTELLGMMDSACQTSTEPPSPQPIQNASSFAPEWGVAPTYDETDAHKKRPAGAFQPPVPNANRGVNNAQPDNAARGISEGARDNAARNQRDDVDDEEDAFSDLERSQISTSTSLHSPRSTHENFEMVLEELKEEQSLPRKRNFFKNPFRGRNNKEEFDGYKFDNNNENVPKEPKHKPPPANKSAHKDMVKQALFPDYDVNRSKSPPLVQDRAAPNRKPPMAQPKKQAVASAAPKTQAQQVGRPPRPEQRPALAKPVAQAPPKQPSRPKLREEEEKKEEIADPSFEMPVEQVASSAAAVPPRKRMSKKGLFNSLRRRTSSRPSTNLETVQEDQPSTPREIKLDSNGARPDPRRSKRHESSVGDDVVEDIYRDLQTSSTDRRQTDSSLESSDYNTDTDRSSQDARFDASNNSTDNSAASDRLTHLVKEADTKGVEGEEPGFVGGFMAMISETVAAVHAGKPIPEEVKNIPDKQPQRGVQPSKSWKEKEKEQEAKKKSQPEPTRDLRRTKSAPQKVLAASGQFKRRKQVWKEVKDPNTGRSYYYHRQTRQTTWKRPKEMDMVEEEPVGGNDAVEAEKENKSNQAQAPQPVGRKRSKSYEEKLAHARQSRGEKAPERQNNAKGRGSVRKQSARDFDPKVWEQKQEIARLLEQMAPPDGTSVESLMAQYEGREGELLAHVKKMKESRPFDEPIAADDDDDEENNLDDDFYEGDDAVRDLNESMRTGGSSKNSFARTQSGITSKQSESTQQMGNGRNRPRAYNSVGGQSSISSNRHSNNQAPMPLQTRIPSKIPAPSRLRSRELMVEEFSQDRNIRSQSYNNDGRGPNETQQSFMRRRPFTTPYGQATIEEEEPNEADSQSHANDTVSALSVNELEFANPPSPHGMTEARRRALDDAIQRQDWDLAAAISDGMRTIRSKQEASRQNRSDHGGEWKQSELDSFIAANDWDAVSEYIARLRSKDEQEHDSRPQSPESHLTGPDMPSSNSKGKYSDMISRERDRDYSESERRSRQESNYDDYSDDDSRHHAKRGRGGNKRMHHSKKTSRSRSFSSESSSDRSYTDDYGSTEESSSEDLRRNKSRHSSRRQTNNRRDRRRSEFRY